MLKNRKGQTLAMVLVVSVVLGITALALVAMFTQETKWSVKTKWSTTAFHTADAAIHRAIWKLQQGDNWKNVTTLTGYRGDTTYHTAWWWNSYTIKIVKGDTTDAADAGVLDQDDPHEEQPGELEGCRTIIVTATSARANEKRKLQVVVYKNTLNRAIQASGQLYLNGSSSVYWGPCISYSTADPSMVIGNGNNIPSAPLFYAAANVRKTNGNLINSGDYANVFPNFSPLPPKPIIDNVYFAQKARTQSTYFSPTTMHPELSGGGNHYPPTSADVTWMNSNYASDIVIFVDTTDGLSYNGTNGCGEIELKNTYGHGVFIIMGNLYMNGNGSQTISAKVPTTAAANGGPTTPDPYSITKVVFNGLVYVAGNFKANGTPSIYGTIIIDGSTADGTGNLSVWYKENLRLTGILDETIAIKSWREKKAQ